MDQLIIMRTFIGVTKTGSFTQTARELGISSSLVSRHVAELERTVGVRLVNRTTRAVSLTGAGARYAEFATRIIDNLDREQEALRGMHHRLEGPLAVVSPKWIGSHEVIDAIVAFSCEYPKIHVRFEVGGTTDRAYGLLDAGFDIALIARNIVREHSLTLRKIADLDFALYASPGYLRRAGEPAQVADLSRHDCLVNTDYDVWHLRHAGREVHLRISDPVYSSNTHLTLAKASLADRGIALLPVQLANYYTPSGALVRVLPDSEVLDQQLYAMHLPDDQSPPRVGLFLDFVTDWLSRGHAVPVRPVPSEHAARDRRSLSLARPNQVPA